MREKSRAFMEQPENDFGVQLGDALSTLSERSSLVRDRLSLKQKNDASCLVVFFLWLLSWSVT